MAIGNAVQRGDWVYVYDERGTNIFSQQGELMGYTSHTVNVRKHGWIYTYDERGTNTNSVPA